jgi:hypothetical protein
VSALAVGEWHPGPNSPCSSDRLQSANPKDVFIELFEMLDEYSPTWYTPERRNRTLAALQVLLGS